MITTRQYNDLIYNIHILKYRKDESFFQNFFLPFLGFFFQFRGRFQEFFFGGGLVGSSATGALGLDV